MSPISCFFLGKLLQGQVGLCRSCPKTWARGPHHKGQWPTPPFCIAVQIKLQVSQNRTWCCGRVCGPAPYHLTIVNVDSSHNENFSYWRGRIPIWFHGALRLVGDTRILRWRTCIICGKLHMYHLKIFNKKITMCSIFPPIKLDLKILLYVGTLWFHSYSSSQLFGSCTSQIQHRKHNNKKCLVSFGHQGFVWASNNRHE